MTIVSSVENPEVELVGAFVDGQCRGVARPVYVEPLNEYLVYLMVYGNEDGERISFRAFGAGAGPDLKISKSTEFVVDGVLGTPESPYTLTVYDESTFIPETYSLSQNYPNPFNPVTTISYGLPEDGFVQIGIYDVTGKQVRTLVAEYQFAGTYSVTWQGENDQGLMLPSGIYFYRMNAGEFQQMHKLVLLK